MTKRVLVLYATRAGSTKEIAESIGALFTQAGVQAEVLPVKKVRSFEEYDAVVLGTAVRMGMLMPEMVRFVRKKKATLAHYPVAAFVVCCSMKKETPEHHATAENFLDQIRREIPLLSEGLFAGKMDYSNLGFLARFIVRNMVKSPQGDFREPEKIKKWTDGLVKLLQAGHTKETAVENPELVGA
ncbi:MAG: flavodoxin domain-containing protein [Chitinispirillaceae bacterium]|nr:flavodoxin domain-containing protein [Chitinispirillaceae bacterium]